MLLFICKFTIGPNRKMIRIKDEEIRLILRYLLFDFFFYQDFKHENCKK